MLAGNVSNPEGNLEYVNRILDGDITVEEAVDGMDPRAAYIAFKGGMAEPAVKPENQVVAVEKTGPEKLDAYLHRITAEKDLSEKLWHYVALPAKFTFVEAPEWLGRKSSAVEGVLPRVVDDHIAAGLTYNTGSSAKILGGIGVGYSMVGTYMFLEPSTEPALAGAAAIMTGSFLQGRAEVSFEDWMEDYLDDLSEDAGEYRIETF